MVYFKANKTMFDVLIIGAGAAGLSAALFTSRRGLRTLVISKDVGGQTATTAEIENYPGIGQIDGVELIEKMYVETLRYGCQFALDEILRLDTTETGFRAVGCEKTYEAESLILAFGKTPRDLGIPGEKEFRGKGISFAPLADGPKYAGKDVAVIGGGNSAFEAVLQLSKIANHVYLVHRRNEFRGEKILLDRLREVSSVIRYTPYAPTAILGTTAVKQLQLVNVENDETRVLDVDAVFPAIGFEPRSGFLKGFVDCDENNQIVIASDCQTSRDGVFAAGDITTVPYQQIVVSAGEGAKAALSSYAYLMKKRGKRALRTDWGFQVSGGA